MRTLRPVTLWSLVGVLLAGLAVLTVVGVVQVRDRLTSVPGNAVPASLTSVDSGPGNPAAPANGPAPVAPAAAPPRVLEGGGPAAVAKPVPTASDHTLPAAPPAAVAPDAPDSTGAGRRDESDRAGHDQDHHDQNGHDQDGRNHDGPGHDGSGHDGPGYGSGHDGDGHDGNGPGGQDGADAGQPSSREELRRQTADAFCDRYNLPREKCEQAAKDNG